MNKLKLKLNNLLTLIDLMSRLLNQPQRTFQKPHGRQPILKRLLQSHKQNNLLPLRNHNNKINKCWVKIQIRGLHQIINISIMIKKTPSLRISHFTEKIQTHGLQMQTIKVLQKSHYQILKIPTIKIKTNHKNLNINQSQRNLIINQRNLNLNLSRSTSQNKNMNQNIKILQIQNHTMNMTTIIQMAGMLIQIRILLGVMSLIISEMRSERKMRLLKRASMKILITIIHMKIIHYQKSQRRKMSISLEQIFQENTMMFRNQLKNRIIAISTRKTNKMRMVPHS